MIKKEKEDLTSFHLKHMHPNVYTNVEKHKEQYMKSREITIEG